jgi:hypothetical protein
MEKYFHSVEAIVRRTQMKNSILQKYLKLLSLKDVMLHNLVDNHQGLGDACFLSLDYMYK